MYTAELLFFNLYFLIDAVDKFCNQLNILFLILLAFPVAFWSVQF